MDSGIQCLNNRGLLFYIGHLSSTVKLMTKKLHFPKLAYKTGSYIMEISTNLGYLDS